MKIEFSKKEIYLKDIKNVEKVIKSGWLPTEFLQKNLKTVYEIYKLKILLNSF